MNIFYLHESPMMSATYMYDKHVVKMILESAQMLCTAHHHYGNGDNVPYKKAHYNHPSTKWCRENKLQYTWLFRHMMFLGDEYTRRYDPIHLNKQHLTIKKCWDSLCHLPPGIPDGEFTQPPQCMPDKYKTDCSVEAYWNYYIGEKHSVANKNETIKTKKFT